MFQHCVPGKMFVHRTLIRVHAHETLPTMQCSMYTQECGPTQLPRKYEIHYTLGKTVGTTFTFKRWPAHQLRELLLVYSLASHHGRRAAAPNGLGNVLAALVLLLAAATAAPALPAEATSATLAFLMALTAVLALGPAALAAAIARALKLVPPARAPAALGARALMCTAAASVSLGAAAMAAGGAPAAMAAGGAPATMARGGAPRLPAAGGE